MLRCKITSSNLTLIWSAVLTSDGDVFRQAGRADIDEDSADSTGTNQGRCVRFLHEGDGGATLKELAVLFSVTVSTQSLMV